MAAYKLKTTSVAITIGHTIHLHKTTRADFLRNIPWTCHELMHVHQFRRFGFFPFLFRYLMESWRKGYYNNKWEAEARAAEQNPALLAHVEFI